MTIRNLDALFAPRSIALVGASNRPGSVGAVLAENLLGGGFRGPVFPVNPHEEAIRSTLNYRSLAELPRPVDLAVIATPAATVPGIVSELGDRGCRAAIVISAGFGEGDEGGGRQRRQALLDSCRPNLLRLLGPNCLGLISPKLGLNASFAHLTPAAGSIAFVSQSGAIATAMLDWAAGRSIGFSHVVSLGDMADIDFGDLLDYLALDPATSAILLYMEAVSDARKFLSAGRIAARLKPVVVLKSGRSQAGARAALSHTGALAGADAVYDAAFRRAGMLRVGELGDLFAAVTTLASGLDVRGDRLAIVTNGGGLGVLAVDALDAAGGRLATLGEGTLARLGEVMPDAWSRGNPVDVLGDAQGQRYADAVAAVLEDPDQDAVLVINCPVAVADSREAAEAVAGLAAGRRAAPVLTAWTGDASAEPSRRLFAAQRIPTYETPDEGVRAFMHLVAYRQNQEALREIPPAIPVVGRDGREATDKVLAGALAAGRSLLTEPESKAVLAAYGVPTVPTVSARSPDEVAAAAARFDGPVAIKILSPDITHKSDVGGVRLNVETAEAARVTAAEMLAAVARRVPDARIDGFTVQPMIRRPQAHELIAGIADDATFGPVVLFGQGGVSTEVVADRSIGLPPLNLALARHMIAATRVSRLLAGYRSIPAADLDAVAEVLVRLSELALDHPSIAELDINPLLADSSGVIALDARIVVQAAGARRPAIQPYPSELEQVVTTGAGPVTIRPVRPQDEAALRDMVERSTEDDRRQAFHASAKGLPPLSAARLTQIDYNREMVLVATPGGEGGEIIAAARLAADPDGERGEFAIMVRSDMKGKGTGHALMSALIAHAGSRGMAVLTGYVLRSNGAMLQMARDLGFRVEDDGLDETVLVTKPLRD